MTTCKTCGKEVINGTHKCGGLFYSLFQKDDKEKPRMELLDPEYMLGVAQVLTFGAKKYSANNWKKAKAEDIERIKGAILRHQMAYMNGETTDKDSGLLHMYHIGCNAMFLAYFDRHGGEHIGQMDFAEYRESADFLGNSEEV